MLVTKRDGTEATFDASKIYNAVMKAMRHGSGIIKPEVAKQVSDEIAARLKNEEKSSVEAIEAMVYDELIAAGEPLTAKAYEGYRAIRQFQRDTLNSTDNDVMDLLGGTSDYWNNENSNKNARLVTTLRDYMAGIVSTDVAKRFILPPDVLEAHENGSIHFHK